MPQPAFMQRPSAFGAAPTTALPPTGAAVPAFTPIHGQAGMHGQGGMHANLNAGLGGPGLDDGMGGMHGQAGMHGQGALHANVNAGLAPPVLGAGVVPPIGGAVAAPAGVAPDPAAMAMVQQALMRRQMGQGGGQGQMQANPPIY